MNKKVLYEICFSIALYFPLLSRADQARLETLVVQSPAEYEFPESIPEKIKTSCVSLPDVVSTQIANKLKEEAFAKIILSNDSNATSPEKYMELKIADLNAPSGGAIAGAKNLTVSAGLFQNGKLMARKIFTRRTKAALRGYRNCDMLGYDAEVIASDVYKWLVSSQGKILPENLSTSFR